jgi:transcription initiation factor TFIIB
MDRDSLVPNSAPDVGDVRPCCDRQTIAASEGNLVCTSCNSIIDRQLDYGAEWRYYGAEDPKGPNPTRCCPPSNGLISTLGSVISGGPRRRTSQWQNRTEASAAAAQASVAAGRAVQRYQVWNSLSYRERVLCGIFDLLTVNAAHNGLPTCILEEAKNLYKKVSDARITRGENREAVIAVSVYVACRKCGAPRSLKEVGIMFNVRPAAMTKAHRTFGLVVAGADEGDCCEVSDFVGRFCSRLGVGPAFVAHVRATIARAELDASVCDAMPTSIAAGAIALANEALGAGLSREAIAEVCVVAPVTVSKLAARLAVGGKPPRTPSQGKSTICVGDPTRGS